MKQLIETKMKEMLELMQAGLTREEFLEAFAKVVESFKKLEKDLNEKLDSKTERALSDLQDTIEQIKNDNESTLSNVKRWATESVGKLFAKSRINEKLGEVEDKLKELNSYELPDASTVALEASKMATEGLLPLIPIVDKVEDELPKLGAKIRDGLELLQDEERLDIKAIKDLQEKLDELKDMIGKKSFVGGGGGGERRRAKRYSLSSQLNGVLKTFSLPSFYDIFDVKLSSVPVLEETTDYTYDASAHTITFTSQIDAATEISSGQTCIVIYNE